MTKTKQETGCEITATILQGVGPFYRLSVIHRFASGNFYTKIHENLSLVTAQGLQHFYTE